ncbi:E3 ubiquitin-protein ligase NEURL1 isoform X1 [Hemibagrus wyckioides]|uniref:E3 ubiquitin-protein ligase NEURL1 isoform X1 n=1 Tax=Hemibagrus wyckioides TaxID=337641 RepID=UPI00266D2EA7|nr:E3 ubiquitin-protein ligase NEURL1 isoform X1 [Hemibagrus wyckioides]
MGNSVSGIPPLQRGHHNRFHRLHNSHKDSLGGPFPPSAHRCHQKPKRCLPLQPCVGIPVSPLLFHPSAKGSQIVMDMAQRTVKRQASFCNAITFSNRPIALYEQVRLKITKKQCCWSGALRLGFTSKDPSRINPESLPKYACPDLVSQNGFWAKALPEELANEGNLVAFWVDKKGRVFYSVNGSSPMLFFSGVRTTETLWALIDVYGLTRGVQLLDSEIVPPDCLRPRSFTAVRGSSSLRREAESSRLSVSLCDLNLARDEARLRLPSAPIPSSRPIPQNSLNSYLPAALESELRFHQLRGTHVKAVDEQTVARCSHGHEEEGTLVFTERPMRLSETIYITVSKSSLARSGSLSYGVTSCDPATLRPMELPSNPEELVDRKEFWAVCKVSSSIHSGDVLSFLLTQDGELILSQNGTNAGMQACVDNSRPLWMFFGLHGAITQLRILGSIHPSDTQGPSSPSSPSSSSPHSLGAGLCSGSSEPTINAGCSGTSPSSPIHLSKSPTFPSSSSSWLDECSICYENAVDTVIYACGHMCLCYSCGLRLKKMANACCPICRRAIKDIIKTYRST